MIIDSLSHAKLYYKLHPGFKQAFEYVRKNCLSKTKPETLRIRGKKLFVVVSDTRHRGKARARLEAHKRYIDIQVIVRGTDLIGYKPLVECKVRSSAFDSKKDVVFFSDAVCSWIEVPKNYFVIFFPHDAHAPLAGKGSIKKAVFKVQL